MPTAAVMRPGPNPELDDGGVVCAWNIAPMEPVSLICTAKRPACDLCPVKDLCAWVGAGSPGPVDREKRRRQAWHGPDPQVQGVIMGGPA